MTVRPATLRTTPLQAVIFDVDGTLAETELDGHRVAFNQAFKEFGLDWNWTPELYGELLAVTGGKERIRLYVETHDVRMLDRRDFDVWVARLHQRKSALYSERVLSGAIPLRPGVARLIQELRAVGIRTAIATTTTPSGLHSLIMAHFEADMSSLFEVIGAGDRVAKKKPAADIYHWVLQQLNLPPEACLAIEDSYAGLTAARAAGIPTVITVNAYTADQDFDGALSVVADLGEPDAAARHLGGLPLTRPCVDLAQLLAWHQEYSAASPEDKRIDSQAVGVSAT
ncbi:HAD-IA family hydrolase [Propionivibrio sp.]|nr:HAD-IA family hydrolase [Propionivibrio sp.]MBK7354574.1 HAD-IA family hydrolase [Propionivibrio sp.]MBK8401944.1 HAD-IA family hydrolase [Propionivibrio sp.]MBK8743758.1 HAD-IA family hydrolase [Propionivibrio sp.]MBK8895505.1 HAD-IA family hydrolase [Propionivibrio sp.]MBL0206718.1 HAD-IA family hydrolase [Propionivibrio sp.]